MKSFSEGMETHRVGKGISSKALLTLLACVGFSGVLTVNQAHAAPSEGRNSAVEIISTLLEAAHRPTPDSRVCIMFQSPHRQASLADMTIGAAECGRLRARFERDARVRIMSPEQAVEHLSSLQQRDGMTRNSGFRT